MYFWCLNVIVCCCAANQYNEINCLFSETLKTSAWAKGEGLKVSSKLQKINKQINKNNLIKEVLYNKE